MVRSPFHYPERDIFIRLKNILEARNFTKRPAWHKVWPLYPPLPKIKVFDVSKQRMERFNADKYNPDEYNAGVSYVEKDRVRNLDEEYEKSDKLINIILEKDPKLCLLEYSFTEDIEKSPKEKTRNSYTHLYWRKMLRNL